MHSIIKGFEWNERNIEHIDRHGVTPQEVEEACYNQPISRKTRNNLCLIYGQTDAGRYLFIVARRDSQGVVYVITARTMIKSEQKYYQKRR